jgi:hypothetical protein
MSPVKLPSLAKVDIRIDASCMLAGINRGLKYSEHSTNQFGLPAFMSLSVRSRSML